VCVGKPLQLDWFEAMQAAKAFKFLNQRDWRLPSNEELIAITYDSSQCSSRKARAVSISILPDFGGGRESPWTHTEAPVTFYSPVEAGYAYAHGLSNGQLGSRDRVKYKQSALLVRGGPPSSYAIFNSEFAKLRETRTRYYAGHNAYEQNQRQQEASRQVSSPSSSGGGGLKLFGKNDIGPGWWATCNSGEFRSIATIENSICGHDGNQSKCSHNWTAMDAANWSCR